MTNGFLLPYDVPGEIFEIEKNKGSFNTKPTPQSRSDESEYIETMTKMIHFEEAAHSKYLLQFNHKNLKLEHTKDTREFQIKIDVSGTVIGVILPTFISHKPFTFLQHRIMVFSFSE